MNNVLILTTAVAILLLSLGCDMAVGWFTASSLAASFNLLWPLVLSWFLKYYCPGVMLGSWFLSLSPFPTLQLMTSADTCEGKHL